MIEHYTDHAANERTYLAWVRTALAFMAFGLVLERFDLVLGAFPGVAESATSQHPAGIARVAGLVLIALGGVVLGISTFRYLSFKRLIASHETRDYRASRTDLVLVGIVALLGLTMAGYVVAQVVG